MSIIVRVTCDPTEWLSPTEATLDYGEVSNDLVGLEEFLSEEDREIVTWHIYTLSIWLDGIIDGPFLLMLMKGSKLKGFHCESCAENFGHWLVDKQVLWKERYHATRSPKDKKETNYTH